MHAPPRKVDSLYNRLRDASLLKESSTSPAEISSNFTLVNTHARTHTDI
jgi:hypothetical protein